LFTHALGLALSLQSTQAARFAIALEVLKRGGKPSGFKLQARMPAMFGMYISASGAQAYSQFLDVVSNNIANADTPGFKREIPVLQARAAEAIEEGDVASGMGHLEDVGGGVYLAETQTEFSVGAVENTGNETDLAIADRTGNTFFMVRDGDEMLLTRAGNFYRDVQGFLRTQDGKTVLNNGAGPIQVDPRYRFQVSDDGVISQAENGLRIQIGLAQPASLDDLVHAGENSFRTNGQVYPATQADRRVRQGYIEKSTTQPMQEMIDLIKASRAYEANVRMIQNQDSTLESLINRILSGE
jgi:flagellar basal-body rod protein FlgF